WVFVINDVLFIMFYVIWFIIFKLVFFSKNIFISSNSILVKCKFSIIKMLNKLKFRQFIQIIFNKKLLIKSINIEFWI
ncbi:hypothetical protein C0075_26765, partial [Rhizobium sp. KAs_5_22]